MILVVGCSNSNENSNENNSENNNENETEEEREYLGVGDSSELKLDDAVGKDHIKFTVNSIEVVDELNGITPEEEQLIRVDITLEDLSGEEHNYDDHHVPSVISSKGKSYSRIEEETTFEELDGGVTNIGVIYDVPENDSYKIRFSEDKYELFINE